MVDIHTHKTKLRVALRYCLCFITLTALSLLNSPRNAHALRKEFKAEKITIASKRDTFITEFTDSGHMAGYLIHRKSKAVEYFHRDANGDVTLYEQNAEADVTDIRVSNSGRVALMSMYSQYVTEQSASAAAKKIVVTIYEPDSSLTGPIELPLPDAEKEQFNLVGLDFDGSNKLHIWGNLDHHYDIGDVIPFNTYPSVVYSEEGESFLAAQYNDAGMGIIHGIDSEGYLYFSYRDNGCHVLKYDPTDMSAQVLTESGTCIENQFDTQTLNSSGDFLAKDHSDNSYHLYSQDDSGNYEASKLRTLPKKKSRSKRRNRAFRPLSLGNDFVLGYLKNVGLVMQDKDKPMSLRGRKILNRITQMPKNCRLHSASSINSSNQFVAFATCKKNGKSQSVDMLISPIHE